MCGVLKTIIFIRWNFLGKSEFVGESFLFDLSLSLSPNKGEVKNMTFFHFTTNFTSPLGIQTGPWEFELHEISNCVLYSWLKSHVIGVTFVIWLGKHDLIRSFGCIQYIAPEHIAQSPGIYKTCGARHLNGSDHWDVVGLTCAFLEFRKVLSNYSGVR